MDTGQFSQDIPPGEISPMDTSSTLTHLDEMTPGFSQTLPPTSHLSPAQNQMIQDATAGFQDPSTLLMHLPIPDPSPSVFMDVIPMSHIPPPSQSFLAEMPTCDPFTMPPPMNSAVGLTSTPGGHNVSASPPSQITSTPLHSVASPYSLGGAPSLESTLEQAMPAVATPGVSAGITNPFAPPPPTVVSFLSPVAKQEIAFEAVADVKEMLADIEQTAKHARVMLQHVDGGVTSSSIDHLNERISQVTMKFAGLVSISSALNSTTAYASPLNSPGIQLHEPKESPLSFPVATMSSASSPMDVSGSDQSRKRCASELEEHRSVKAPKREPTDDVPLPMPFAGTSSTGEIPSAFAMAALTLPPVSLHPPPSSHSAAISTPKFSPHGPFSTAPPLPPTPSTPFPSFTSNGTQLVEFNAGLPTPPVHSFNATPPPWPEPTIPTRHHHSLSMGSISGAHFPTPTTSVPTLGETFSAPSLPSSSTSAGITSPIGRISRSGSISNSFPTSFTFGQTETLAESTGAWANNQNQLTPPNKPSAAVAGTTWIPSVDNSSSISPSSTSDKISLNTMPSTAHSSPHAEDDEDDGGADSDDEEYTHSKAHHSSDGPSSSGGSDVPLEYRAEVDRIFFEFLNKICSNLEATDSKGEPIHQTLMAKKMQRLDESPDFRPFKFRIQAFTHAFLEELASHGYPEERIPMKKVRNYLWRSPYILRFNEDGKKAKSKGNHIWNIEAKKIGDGKWDFRPFQRKLAGTPPSVAYCGLLWSWSPHVWDPQASWQNVPVEYSSPTLPAWLSWKGDVLSGVPPPDAENCRITANCKFTLDGQEGTLSHSFYLTVAPVNSSDAPSLTRSRRPSLAGDPPRRSTSDSVLFQAVQRAKPRMLPAGRPSPADTRVIRVLQSVAQRVTEEAESQFVSASPPKASELQDLVKQKHVLDQTVDAFDKAIAGENQVESRRLAVAAQNVVIQAAHTVIADRTVASGGIPMPQSETAAIKSVTVNELSDATQDAIAQAVKMEGTTSTEVDIMVAATSILKLRTVGPPGTADSHQINMQQPRSQSAGAVPRLMGTAPPYHLSSVSEYV